MKGSLDDLGVLRTFALVAFLSAKNRARQTLRRLRKPRYFLSVVVGIAYFGWLIMGQGRGGFAVNGENVIFAREGAIILGSVLVTIIMLGAWALPKSNAGVTFSEAEIQMLFPAPLTRRQLLLYKIVRSQPAILFGAVMMRVFLFRDGNLLGIWVGFAMIDLYFLMVAFGRSRLRQIGVGFLSRAVIVLLLAGAILWMTASYLDADALGGFVEVSRESQRVPFGRVATVVESLGDVFFTFPLSLVYFVPSMLIRPGLATSFISGLPWIPASLLIGFISFYLANRIDVTFEDASIEASKKKAEKLARQQETHAGRRVIFRHTPAMFSLAEQGPPETAIIWKNLIAAGRITLPIFALVLASLGVVAVLTTIKAGIESGLHATGVIAFVAAALVSFIGPLTFRNDLRSEMRRMDVLKLLPLTGYRMVASQIAAPAILIFLLQIVLLLGGAAAWFPVVERKEWLSLALWIPALLVLGLPVNLIQLLFHNGIAIVLPAWALDMSERKRGIEQTGKGILMMLSHLLFLVVGLLPGALVFSVVFWIASFVFDYGPGAGTIAVVPAAALLLAEAHLMLEFLGGQFEEIDVANDLELSESG